MLLSKAEVRKLRAGVELDKLVATDVLGYPWLPRNKTYSDNLGACDEVLEHITQQEDLIKIELTQTRSKLDGKSVWFVYIHLERNHDYVLEYDESLPVAICHAAILAYQSPP